MLELFALFLIVVGLFLFFKIGLLFLHLIFIPFQIVGALIVGFLGLLALPFLLLLAPLLLVGLVALAVVLFHMAAAVVGALICCLL